MILVSMRTASWAIAGLIAVAFVAAPVGLDYNFAPELESAFAKGKGGGKSGGSRGSKGSKSGTSGKGKGGDGDGPGVEHAKKGKNKGESVEASHDEHDDGDGKIGNGHIKAKGNGHQKHQHADADHDGEDGHKNLLGNLNAAHASPTARLNASENSMVGLLAAYARAVEEGREGYETEEEQQQRLGEISNKSYFDPNFDDDNGAEVVDAEVVREVNALLGVENDDEQEDEPEE